ncbi:fungal-specific transcription factor domain-containing protein [Aspergillus granulosus]|uniref:Fungal-specific transcription factor domain-containing protein n=1 Tax=Aspergillus granulosus TaxID=176169 RepID=A0ABR4HKT0_9EURO
MLSATQDRGEPESPRKRPRKRTRTGWLVYAFSHARLNSHNPPTRLASHAETAVESDGARPQCRNCQAKGSTCQWGLKASFHPSRSYSLSASDSAALAAIEQQRKRFSYANSRFGTIIDQTSKVIRYYDLIDDTDPSFLDSEASDHENDTGNFPQLSPVVEAVGDMGPPASPPSAWTPVAPAHSPDMLDNATCQNYPSLNIIPQPLSGEISIGDLLFRPRIGSVELTRRLSSDGWAPSPVSELHHASPFVSPTRLDRNAAPLPTSPHQLIPAGVLQPTEIPLPVSVAEKARLLCAYLQETGPWCETTDSEMHFTVKSIHSMMKSPAFTGAVMALASRQLDHARDQPRPVTLELYQYTIQLLLRQDLKKQDACVLAACTLLCVYEMMASGVHEWRRHLKGCAAHLQAQKWNGSSKGIVKSCFWAFARIDVWAAFVSGKTTLIPTNFWLDNMSITSVAGQGDVDDYCNLANLIFAEIVNLLASVAQEDAQDTTSTASISVLWEKLQDWRRLRPPEVKPLLRNPPTSMRPFPDILYSRSSTICGNTFYHAGCILLLQTGHPGFSVEDISYELKNAVWHARELGGISTSNPSHANWVNQLQPLYIAGTVFASSANGPNLGSDQDEYAAEKILLLKQLARIERETGWKTSDRAASLRSLWGLA